MNASLRRLLAALVLTLGLGWSSQASAWGDTGHRTVCEIALRNLTPVAKAEVARLLRAHPAILGANPLNGEYGWACTYPDHPAAGGPGRRSPEHFVNYARTTLIVTSASGCGVTSLCVITAIASDYAMLQSPASSDLQRAAALVYLGHWLGDIHQPLHSSFADDQGGNQVDSSGLCTFSLHSTWDTCILQARTIGSGPSIPAVRALAERWSGQATDTDRAQGLSSVPWQGSAESYAVTLNPQVRYCVMVQSAGQYSATQMAFAQGQQKQSVAIDAAYMDWAMPIIQRRITQAGVRLAHLLNRALDPAYRG
ncbi:MAG: nuclease [Sphingomonadales bacterium]|nr:nuclease [Sphingomonadales bacterium]